MNTEQIWNQYSCSLKGLLRAKISDPADVDDLLQEILIKTHRHMDSLRSREKLKPWLFRLANNTVIDFYRRRRPDQEQELAELWYGEDPDQVQQQLSQCILPFIEQLPSDSATLLKQIDIDGKSQKQVAAEKGIPYSTLKSRVQQARGQLRGVFENCCHLQFDAQGRLMEYHERSKECSSC